MSACSVEIVSATSAVDAATITAPPPAGPANVAERRDVHAQRVDRRRRPCCSRRARRRSPQRRASRGSDAAAERQRARDDPAAACRPPRPSPASLRPASRARRASSAARAPTMRAERSRLRGCEDVWSSPRRRCAGDEDVDGEAEDDHRDERRGRGRENRPQPGGSSPEHEPDAAHGVDQRRLAELPAQVRDVAVDDVRVAPRRPRSARSPARG